MISEIRYILDNRLANSIEDALNLDDAYLTLSSNLDTITGDIERKLNEHIRQQNK